jgi:hypothetical protein
VKLFQRHLSHDNKILPIGVCFVISTLISAVAVADDSKDAFPPTSAEQKKAVSSPSPVATNPQVVLPVQNQRYPTQQMQGYRPYYPYAYYYPQQQMPSYTPRQWGYYPQQGFNTPYRYYQQPYAQPQANSYPTAKQRPAYQHNSANATANNSGRTLYPMRKKIKKEKHSWGDERNIWPDFYTDFTGDAWDKMVNAPFDVGRMPGGWRAPSLSTPDPVTVSDAVANQVPPIVEEMSNMTNFAN